MTAWAWAWALECVIKAKMSNYNNGGAFLVAFSCVESKTAFS